MVIGDFYLYPTTCFHNIQLRMVSSYFVDSYTIHQKVQTGAVSSGFKQEERKSKIKDKKSKLQVKKQKCSVRLPPCTKAELHDPRLRSGQALKGRTTIVFGI